MADRLNSYDGGVFPGDTAATASTYARRGSDGSLTMAQANATAIKSTGGTALGALAVTTSAALSATLTSGDTFLDVDATGGAVVMTLPPIATATAGQAFILTKVDSGGNAAGFAGSGAELINGSNTLNTSTQYATLKIRANAALTKWLTW